MSVLSNHFHMMQLLITDTDQAHQKDDTIISIKWPLRLVHYYLVAAEESGFFLAVRRNVTNMRQFPIVIFWTKISHYCGEVGHCCSRWNDR